MTKVKAGNSKRQKSSDDDEPLDVDVDNDDDRKIVNIAFQSALVFNGIVSISSKAIKFSKHKTEANVDVNYNIYYTFFTSA